MMAVFAWLTGHPLFRKVALVLGLMLAVLLALAGFRRKAEAAGRLIERERNREEIRKAEKRMESVVRPDSSDLDRRLRDGTF